MKLVDLRRRLDAFGGNPPVESGGPRPAWSMTSGEMRTELAHLLGVDELPDDGADLLRAIEERLAEVRGRPLLENSP